jgi:hypothetical protein
MGRIADKDTFGLSWQIVPARAGSISRSWNGPRKTRNSAAFADEILEKLTMRINNAGSDFAAGAPDGATSTRPAPVANGGVEPVSAEPAASDEVVLSDAASAAFSAIQAVVNSGNYEPNSLLTAGRVIDSALVKIE